MSSRTATDIQGALSAIRDADSFVVISHTGPDGDALGSALGTVHFLRALGKERVVCALQDPVPRVYKWLPGADEIVAGDALNGNFDLAIVTDVAQLDRTGTAGASLPKGQKILVLDHHLEENPEGTLNFVDPSYASASEIVLDLFEAAGLELTPEATDCIYVGLTTDTGGFRYANTNARAHRNAAKLVAAGAQVNDISSRVFDVISVPKSRLLRRVLDRMEYEVTFAHSYLTEADFAECEALPEDSDGLVNFARNLEGITVGALFRELDGGITKVSLRSKDGFNSASLLSAFGGGGHAGAAGATLQMPLSEATAAVCAAVQTELGLRKEVS